MHFIILSFPPFSAENIVKAVKWLKDGHAVTNMDPKYQKFDSKLRVNNVQTEDGGVYQCFVTLDGGKQMQSSGELRLGGKEYRVFCYMNLSNLQCTKGLDYTFCCFTRIVELGTRVKTFLF